MVLQVPLVRYGTLVHSSHSVSQHMIIWHHGKKQIRANKSVIFKYCLWICQCYSHVLRTLCGVPHHPKWLQKPFRTLWCCWTQLGNLSDVSAFLADRKYSQLFYPHIPRNKCQKLNVQDTEQKLSSSWIWSLPEKKGNRLYQQSTEMSEKIWCPFNDYVPCFFHMEIKQHCLSAQHSHHCRRQYFYSIFFLQN